MKVPYAKYIAIPTWDGEQWQVRIEDYDYEHRGDTIAVRLMRVAPRASALLSATFGVYPHPIKVSVEPHLPEQVEAALQDAEGQGPNATRHLDAIVAGLRQTNMSGDDIAAILAERALTAAPSQPLVIANSEIATHGLSHHPGVLAVESVDGDTVLTCCRICAEGNPHRWVSRQPDGTSAAVYEPCGRCDLCGRDIAETGREGWASQDGRDDA